MRIDLHNHTTLCNHATGTMDEYVQKAILSKIDVFGFSCHAPMPFDLKYRMSLKESEAYEKDIINLKEKYKNNITILLGYEVDYMNESSYLYENILNAKVDYLIGSVHFLDKWGFDNPEFIGAYENKNIDLIWKEYFQTLTNMVKTKYFDIVGHLDLIKTFKFFPKNNINNIAMETMEEIKKSNMVLEINSSGLRKSIKEQYPSKNLLQVAYDLNIPITFGSDAHSIEQIGYGYNDVVKIAKEVGYKSCITFKNKVQKEVGF